MEQKKGVKLSEAWLELVGDEFKRPYFKDLKNFLLEEKKTEVIYPPSSLIFNAFDQCEPQNLKVVILGQDPYHGPGQAHGLSFSVPVGVKIPPSLQNIFKELQKDLGLSIPKHGDLSGWAQQGVFLLNTVLTVRQHAAGSHQKRGWEQFTDQVIAQLSKHRKGLVFMLWGKFAQSKSPLIDPKKHLILETSHPSPFSAHRGFLGSQIFSKANQYLSQQGQAPIDWSG
jgi:uracil-DNA glycosylase